MDVLILKNKNLKANQVHIYCRRRNKKERKYREAPQNWYQILAFRNNHSSLDINFCKITISTEGFFFSLQPVNYVMRSFKIQTESGVPFEEQYWMHTANFTFSAMQD